MKFDQLIKKHLLEMNSSNGDLSPKELGDKFMKDVLSRYSYKVSGEGHIHCGWTTKTFYNWALKQGVNPSDLQVIYFVWPEKDTVSHLKSKGALGAHYADEGESHIAPVYKDNVLDFTVGQFTGEDSYRVTSLSDVRSGKSVYAKYGYGTNKLNDEHYIVGKYENVVKKAEMQEPDLFAPPLKD